MPKVSIIIPVYNVEKYLRECLDSVLAQTYTDYEVILIDDGSTDASLSIANEYIKKFGSKLNIISKKNEGLSSARNLGVNKAVGDYLYFIDSDDYIADNMISLCVDVFLEDNVDIVFFNATAFSDNEFSTIFNDYDRGIEAGMYDSGKLFELFLKSKYIVSACCYMLKKITYSHIKFPYGLLHEDNYYTTKLLCVENTKSYVLKETLFHRRVRENSITTSEKTKKHSEGYLRIADLLFKENRDNKHVLKFCLILYSSAFDIMDEIGIKLSLRCKFSILIKLFYIGKSIKIGFRVFFPNLFSFLKSMKSKVFYRSPK